MPNHFCGVVFLLGVLTTTPAWSQPALVRPASRPTFPAPETVATAQKRVTLAQARGNFEAFIRALGDEADASLRSRNFTTAEQVRVRVLHLEEDHAGRDSVPVSDALLNLGWFYADLARYEEAQAALDRCLDIRQRRLGPDTPGVAEVLNALGSLEENRGNSGLAEGFYLQAIAIQEKALGLQSAVTANTWNNLATLYWITGDYAPAQKYFDQALAVREKVLGPDSGTVAQTLNNLALLDSSLGDYDEAEAYFQRALRIRIAKLGPDHPATAATLGELGLLYVREGDDAKAEPLLERTAALQQGASAQDDPDVARTLEELATLYDRRKLYAKAEPLHQRALAMRLRTLGDEHPDYAASLWALARHEHEQGRLKEALPLYEQARRIDADALGSQHPDTLAIANDEAYCELESRQPDEADQRAHDVAGAQQAMLNSVLTFAPEHQRMGFEQTVEPCDLPAALADADLLAEVALRTKGVVLDSLLEDASRLRAERDPDVSAMLEKQKLLLSRLDDAQDVDFSQTATAVADRRQLAQEEQDLEAKLTDRGLGNGRTRRALATSPKEVESALDPHTALVEYVAYHRYTGLLTSQPSYGAVILARGQAPQWVPLGDAPEIDARIGLYQKYLRKRVRESALTEVLHGLDTALCAPVLATLPAGIHRLVISPDGNLNFVSFATLLDASGRFLAEDYDLRYVSSGRDLLEKATAPAPRQLVVFADPDYDHAAGVPEATTARVRTPDAIALAPLPGTEREAGFLADEARAHGCSALIYRGRAASKANLEKIDSPDILHLATHGLYLSEADVPNIAPAKPAGAPAMTRSVLAFAGAAGTLRDWESGTFPPPENDGILTAEEAAGLNLDHTWLVVLSACDTGTGEARAGEGVLGLRRGFAEAGARNLLLTLWPVDDAESVDLMRKFYDEALRTGDPGGALAHVQRDALVETRSKSGLSASVRKLGPFILSN